MVHEKEKTVRGLRLKMLDTGNVQIYGQQRSRGLAAIGIKHSAWRLVMELSPALIADLQTFVNEPTASASSK